VVEDHSKIALNSTDVNPTFEDKLSVGDVKDFTTVWPLFLDHMLKNWPNLGSFLSIGYVASCTESTINIKFPSSNSFQFQEVTKKHNRDQIERFLFEFTGRKIELHITVETKKPDAQERNFLNQLVQMPSTINDEIENEPIIQVVLDIFDGEVLN
jgi:chromosomal replication initiation ATPase DnaA